MSQSFSPIDEGMMRLSVDDVIDRIESLIFHGEYTAGMRLPEQMLCDTFGVGRGVLREAIRTLEGRGLLVRVPNAGVNVVDLSIDEIEQLMTIRESLEGMAARLAAEYMTLHEVRQLRAAAQDLEQLGTQASEAIFSVEAQQDFHRLIVLGSRNKWIINLLCRDYYILMRLCRMRAGKLRRDRPEIHDEHLKIVDCIECRDGDGAEDLMRAHARHSRERLLMALRT